MNAGPEDEFDDRNSAVEADGQQDAGEPAGLFDAPRRWSWGDFVYLASAMVFNVAGSVTMWCGQVTDQIGAHQAYKQHHVDFAANVMKDIGKL